MNESNHASASTLDLIPLWPILWGYKYVILAFTAVCVVGAVVLGLTTTPIFRAEVVVTEVQQNGMGGVSGLAGQLGGLASLAGVNLSGGGGAGQEAQAVLRSNFLIQQFIQRNRLLDTLFPGATSKPTLWMATRKFKGDVVDIREDKRNGTTVVAIEWSDPKLVAEWANGFVALANEIVRSRALTESTRNINYLNAEIAKTNVIEIRKVMYNLIETETKTLMLANGKQEYAFSVVDPAVVPEVRVRPRRTVMVLLGAVLGLVLGTLTGVLHYSLVLQRRSASARA